MKDITCAICLSSKYYHILYPKNFNLKDVNETTFSARRIPDKYHYRLVKCKKCGLVYSNPILEEEEIKRLYKRSKFTYNKEIDNLSQSYGDCLDRINSQIINKDRFLEIGCGNGFFLREAAEHGFKDIWGLEPSIDAVKKSPIGVGKIINDVLKPNLFKKDYFDFICFFQTLDHITDPNLFLQTCHQILKKKGIVFCIVHDVDAFSAKVLGEKSPIFDIAHINLFSKKTLRKIFEKNKFQVIDIFDIANVYSLDYWLQMFPVPSFLKQRLFPIPAWLRNKRIKIKAGNIGIVVKK